MAYSLDRKLKQLEFERQQVLQHLALVDKKIETLKQAIEIAQAAENRLSQHNTENFIYRQRYWLFKGKIRKYILPMLRNEPTKGFTIAEITQRIFEIEQNPDTPSAKHFDSVRKQLNEFQKRGWITRTQRGWREVEWQWKSA